MRVNQPAITLRETEKKESRTGPSERELWLQLGTGFTLMWATIFLLHRSTTLVFAYGDNVAYRDVANAILHWDFRGLQLQHFMGYPYLIAAVSLLFHVPSGFALWLIAVASAALSVWLTARLFGTVVAGYFAFTNIAWLQLAYLGGSEPLALGLASLLAFRRDRILLAALLGSLAVTVRPLMIFVLVSGNWAGAAVSKKVQGFSHSIRDRTCDRDTVCIAAGALFWRPSAHGAHVHDSRLRSSRCKRSPWPFVRMAASRDCRRHARLLRAVDKLTPEFLLDWARSIGRSDDVFEQVPEICEGVSARGDLLRAVPFRGLFLRLSDLGA